MKKILVLGATGRIGKILLPMLESRKNSVTAYVRDPKKAIGAEFKHVSVIQGDVLDTERLSESMKEKDVVIAVLSGELLMYAKSIAIALQKSRPGRILWVTGMGIHHEVPGEVGKLLDELCKKMPEYVQAADRIADSGTPYTLIRAAHLTNGTNDEYFVQEEGQPLHANSVDRIAVARFMADLVKNDCGINKSLGVTN